MILLRPLKEGGIRPLMGLIYSLGLKVNLYLGGREEGGNLTIIWLNL